MGGLAKAADYGPARLGLSSPASCRSGMKKPRAEARGLPFIAGQRSVRVTVAVAIDVVAVALVAILPAGGSPAAVGAVVAVTDRVADQAAGNATHGGADQAVRGEAADQRARTGAQHGLCARVIVAGRSGRNSTGAQRNRGGGGNLCQTVHEEISCCGACLPITATETYHDEERFHQGIIRATPDSPHSPGRRRNRKYPYPMRSTAHVPRIAWAGRDWR